MCVERGDDNTAIPYNCDYMNNMINLQQQRLICNIVITILPTNSICSIKKECLHETIWLMINTTI